MASKARGSSGAQNPQLHFRRFGFGLCFTFQCRAAIACFLQGVIALENDQLLALLFQRHIAVEFLFLDLSFLIDRSSPPRINCFIGLAQESLPIFRFERFGHFRRGTDREKIDARQIDAER